MGANSGCFGKIYDDSDIECALGCSKNKECKEELERRFKASGLSEVEFSENASAQQKPAEDTMMKHNEIRDAFDKVREHDHIISIRKTGELLGLDVDDLDVVASPAAVESWDIKPMPVDVKAKEAAEFMEHLIYGAYYGVFRAPSNGDKRLLEYQDVILRTCSCDPEEPMAHNSKRCRTCNKRIPQRLKDLIESGEACCSFCDWNASKCHMGVLRGFPPCNGSVIINYPSGLRCNKCGETWASHERLSASQDKLLK